MPKFLSTLSLRRATSRKLITRRAYHISIHALLAESDPVPGAANFRSRISIHALLAESDAGTARACAWAAYFYPRSPCGERLANVDGLLCVVSISIHALLAESDSFRSPRIALMVGFLSTLSLRRATHPLFWESLTRSISIHALLAESDSQGDLLQCPDTDFYPRSPCGERLALHCGVGA